MFRCSFFLNCPDQWATKTQKYRKKTPTIIVICIATVLFRKGTQVKYICIVIPWSLLFISFFFFVFLFFLFWFEWFCCNRIKRHLFFFLFLLYFHLRLHVKCLVWSMLFVLMFTYFSAHIHFSGKHIFFNVNPNIRKINDETQIKINTQNHRWSSISSSSSNSGINEFRNLVWWLCRFFFTLSLSISICFRTCFLRVYGIVDFRESESITFVRTSNGKNRLKCIWKYTERMFFLINSDTRSHQNFKSCYF